MGLRMPDGHVMPMPNDVGWTTYARIVKKPGVGWVFIGYSTPKWGRLADAVRQLPAMQRLDEENRLYFAEAGGQWVHV